MTIKVVIKNAEAVGGKVLIVKASNGPAFILPPGAEQTCYVYDPGHSDLLATEDRRAYKMERRSGERRMYQNIVKPVKVEP